jgi:rSAM/selenodomain-associated transferase 2
MNIRYSVIIPTYNEAERIAALISQIRSLNVRAQIIISDANSPDGTARLATEAGAEVAQSSLGRGIQCRAGAEVANGDIFIFLHADSRLAADSFTTIDQFFSRADCQVARFRLAFDHPHWLLGFYAFFSRFDTLLTRFGDQGIVVRRSFYEQLGGIRPWPLLEDVDFFRRASAVTKIILLPTTIITSARKFLRTGVLRRQIKNASILLRYCFGTSPEDLYKIYYQKKDFLKPC